ncbi:MAG: hypothetical protein EA426_20130 [Spirochaetaceae bacterium]|nr:MAG: hypothetical protein EA426_20130 [Spirochaetaceae bacterium]
MRRRGRSDAMMYSISEFAFILAFLCIGIGALLYGRLRAAERIAESHEKEIEFLTAEVKFLNELLEEKQYGNVPCWRRPDGTIPFVVGRLTIHAGDSISLASARTGTPTRRVSNLGADVLERNLRPAVADLFQSELSYAGEYNCYLRIEVANETDNFPIYRDVAAIVTRIGMVAVHE